MKLFLDKRAMNDTMNNNQIGMDAVDDGKSFVDYVSREDVVVANVIENHSNVAKFSGDKSNMTPNRSYAVSFRYSPNSSCEINSSSKKQEGVVCQYV